MKYVKPHPEKCGFVQACMRACAQKTQKSEDTSFSSIVVTRSDDGSIDINVCNQCGTCIDICPVTAISRAKTGTVVINKNLCVGCYACVEYCPTGSMRTHPSRTVPFKCTACGACVEACPAGALELAEGGFELSYLERDQAGEPGATFPKAYF